MFFIKRSYVLLLIACFAFTLSITAQDRSKAIALKNILEIIQKQHNVTFNYINTDIATYQIEPPAKSLTLEEKISYLQKQTTLSFENIDNKFINIFKYYENDFPKICGYVYAKEDNSPIANANIQFIKGSSKTSNKNGFFELKKETSNQLAVSYVGYKTKLISINDSENKDCLKIFLEYDIPELNTIIANHFLTTGISKKVSGIIEIKPKKLGILPGLIEPDVLQTMLQVPGINSTDESVASINVRGGTHDQNLFLWNGIRMYQTGHFFGLISAFNPNLAHTISLSKNGSSAFYGESVSSVVSISSNPTDFEKNTYGAGTNMINGDIYARVNVNKNGFLEISGRRSITDLVKSPTYNQYYNKAFQNATITNLVNNQNIAFTNNEMFNFYDATLKYFQKIGTKNQLVLDLITINDKLNVLQQFTNKNSIQSEKNTLNQKNYGANFSFKRIWNTNNISTINIYSSSYGLSAEQNKIETKQIVNQENSILDTGIKLENNHTISPKVVFNNGYQYTEIGSTNLDEATSPVFYRKVKDVIRTHALILELKYNDTLNKINITTGLRANYIEQFNRFIIEPRFQFNYGISKHLNLEILGELKSQNCVQIIDAQKDYFGIEKRRWILANNSSIPILRGKQISFNLSYSKNNWLFTLENFYKKVTGISSTSQGFQNQFETLKTNGDYTIIGTEVLIQKKINRFITWLSYSYNDNNYNFPNTTFQPIFSNNYELDHVLSWAGIYEKKSLKFALGAKWYSGRPETTPINGDAINNNPSAPYIMYNNPPNNKRLDNFFQINFSTTYKWQTAGKLQYKLGVSVTNILNRKNEINEYYRINSSVKPSFIEDVKTFSLLRTPNLSLRVNF